MSPIIIIGSGHAGITLVREIRLQDKDIPITLISRESVNHYYKPNLSKALSLGKEPCELILKSIDKLATDLNIQIIEHTEVTRIDAHHQTLTAFTVGKDPRKFYYQSLVFAVGANAIKLPIGGTAAEKIISVNNLADYQLFREEISASKRVLIIGAGFVGCEFASDLTGAGFHIDVVDIGQWPLQKALPQALGNAVKSSLASSTLYWHFNTHVKTVNKAVDKMEDALEVTLSNGRVIETDVVLSAVGITPAIALAKKSGLDTAKGIIVDSFLQTNHPNIYALGDCAEYQHTLLPFIAPATSMAKSLSCTLLGNRTKAEISSLAVAVKIPSCPTIICPAVSDQGNWQISGTGNDLSARFIDSQNNITGFALTGKCISQKNTLIQECLAPFQGSSADYDVTLNSEDSLKSSASA